MRTEEELLLELHAKNAAVSQCKSLLGNSMLSEYAKNDLVEIIEELTEEIVGVERLLKNFQ